MSQEAYPTVSDLATFLTDSGVTNSTATQRTAAIAAAITAWERLTGRIPFKVEGTDSTNYYTPEGGDYLAFTEGGYVSITSVTVGYSLDSAGTARTLYRDFWPNPLNGTPILGLHGYWCGGPRSVVVVGKRGYAAQIPDDAWQAILQGAAAQAYAQANNLKTKGLESISIGQGDLTLKFGGNKMVGEWAESFLSAACYPPYRRMGL